MMFGKSSKGACFAFRGLLQLALEPLSYSSLLSLFAQVLNTSVALEGGLGV